MRALILAAGQGTRLKKYTNNLPKGMLSFAGKTIIERQIEQYRACGIDDIIIVRGYAAYCISYSGITYRDNVNYESTNMVMSLLTASDLFDDDMIVSYSDILFENTMLKKMISSDAEFAVAVDDNWKYYWNMRYGTVDYDTESMVIDEDNRIVNLGRENPPIDEIDARYVGLLKFSMSGLNKISSMMEKALYEFSDKPWQQSGKTAKQAYMTDLLNALIENGETVKAVRFKNGWIEFDTNEDYEKAIEWYDNGMIDRVCNMSFDA